ncbi:putative pentatricopeptide repeat-containing protein At1g12700, mitochondrial isoform X2 [Tripterygium wilfordii]|uniref:putative pentatricopeptide repeat-containing protein At1g12700, mitochondrial isoform X2 n=1 Tax=Tripterygium wilfordii TaxID=458696 RepID=UPI0018F7FE19|nr:putative pentatricopeptide repeat-containing protein At1g12700, mitochondrial isoform X2 [Tripterygium wilfordii]
MAVKLSTLTITKRTRRWVTLVSPISSLSCTSNIQVTPETYQDIQNANDYDSKIQFLRSKLCSDNLVRVLDNTTDLYSAVKIFKWAALQKRFSHTANTYCQIILKLGLAGNLKEMEGFCQNMVKERCTGVEDALVSLIHSFVKHGRLYEAIRVLVNMILGGYKPSIAVFNGILGALVEENKGFEDVLYIYKEMVKAGVVPNVDTLNYLLEVLFEAEKVDIGLDQYKKMNKKGLQPNSRTFEILIRGLILRNRVDESVSILDEMFQLGCPPELRFYICIIPLYCKENKLEVGIKLFKMMRVSNSVPDPFIFVDMIRCLCKNLWLDYAVDLLEEMIEHDFSPPSDVLTDIVHGFCKLGKIKEAIAFVEDKHVRETLPHDALLGSCCNAGNFSIAKDLLEKMCVRNIADSSSWNVLIRWLCEKVAIKKAFELLGRMIVSSFSPECATYSALVVGNCRLRKYEDAMKLFHWVHIKCWVLDSNSYFELVEGLCGAEKYIEAIEVFRYMSRNKCYLQSSLFDKLIRGICEFGKVDEAVRLHSVAYNSGTPCANSTYASMMLGLYKSCNRKALSLLLSQMLVAGFTLDVETYCILIQNLIDQNKTKDCALFFNIMVNEETYNILINGLWKEGDKEKAHRLLDLMLERGWVPNAATHKLLMGSCSMEANSRELAYETPNERDHVSNILAEGLGKL